MSDLPDWPELEDYWITKAGNPAATPPFCVMGRSKDWSVVVTCPDLERAAAALALVPLLGLNRAVLIADITELTARYIVMSSLDRDGGLRTIAVDYGMTDQGQIIATGGRESTGDESGALARLLVKAMGISTIPAENRLGLVHHAHVALTQVGCGPSIMPLGGQG